MNKTTLISVMLLCCASVYAGNFTVNVTSSVNSSHIAGVDLNLSYVFYQETANESTQEGGLSTGTYFCPTESSCNGGTSTNKVTGVNYTIPPLSTPYLWQNSFGTNPTQNTTLNSTCYDSTNVYFFLQHYLSFSSNLSLSGIGCGITGWATSTLLSQVNTSYTNFSALNFISGNLKDSLSIDGNYSSGSVWSFRNSSGSANPGYYNNNTSVAAFREEGIYWQSVRVFESDSPIQTNIQNNWSVSNITYNVSAPGYYPSSGSLSAVSSNQSISLSPIYLNISFYDENTGLLLSGITSTAFVTGTSNSFNFTTSTGSYLLSPVYNDTYAITYSATGYAQREYSFTSAGANSSIILYLLNDSDDTIVLATVFDTVGRRVESATIYMDKKNLSGTNYYTVESCTTNALGQCLLHVDLYDTTYQFRIDYGGSEVFNSGDTKVSQTAISFTIVTSENTLGEVYDIGYFLGNLTYDNSTTTFSFEYNDVEDAFSSVCLRTVIRTDSAINRYNSTCSTSDTGTLTQLINTSVGDEWTGIAYGVRDDGSEFQLDSLSVVVDQFLAQFGKTGLFYFGFLLIGGMMFSGLIHPIIPPILGGVTVWVLNALGFIGVGTSAVISLLAVVVIIVMINKRT